MNASVLRLEGITKDFPGVRALDGVDFELAAGEVHALLGENGAGKSTLIKIVTGVYSRDGGRLVVDGEEVDAASARKAKALGIAAIYQEQNLCPELTVAENLFTGRLARGAGRVLVSWRSTFRQAEELLAPWDVDFRARDRVGRLNVAQRQVIEIIKAVSVTGLKILILDEPTAALNDEEVERLFGIIRRLRGQGISVIYISHRLNEVFSLCDRVTVLRDGRNVGSRRVAEASKGELIGLMIGRDLAEMYPKRAIAKGGVILEVRALSRSPALRDVGFSLRRGEILGVYGLLGSGKEELGRCLFGALRPDSGQVLVAGRPASPSSVAQAVRRGIGYVPEDRKREGIIDLLNVRENLTLANIRSLGRLGFLNRARERERSARWVGKLAIKTPGLDTSSGSLSGGNQQKVVIGRWLDSDSRLLILCEPTHGVDVGAKVEIYTIVEELCQSGTGVLMISSEIPELAALCDRVLVLYRGRIAGELAAGEISQENILSLAMRGER